MYMYLLLVVELQPLVSLVIAQNTAHAVLCLLFYSYLMECDQDYKKVPLLSFILSGACPSVCM